MYGETGSFREPPPYDGADPSSSGPRPEVVDGKEVWGARTARTHGTASNGSLNSTMSRYIIWKHVTIPRLPSDE